MKYLHTMVRVADLDKALDFYCNKLGLTEARRFSRPMVIEAGWSDDDIDRLIKQAQKDVEPSLPE